GGTRRRDGRRECARRGARAAAANRVRLAAAGAPLSRVCDLRRSACRGAHLEGVSRALPGPRGGPGAVTTALAARDVFRVYATPRGSSVALQGLNLDVSSGEIVVVLGPSGSGKSTLLRVVAGFERPSAGSVQVLGRDLGELSGRDLARYRSTELGFLGQHYTGALDRSEER